MLRLALPFALSLLVASSYGPAARAEESSPAVTFAQNIQPLLAQRCLECHGPDAQEGGLRLDRRETALAELDSGDTAIVPGDPAASALIERVASESADLRMPPEGEPLTHDEVEQLRKWIAAGAHFTGHWAYEPLSTAQPPVPRNTVGIVNEIDQFVRARLEQEGIEPSPPADRYTLIKRLYYDLHGVTPTIAEVDDFVANTSPDAYERLVDRLLASPRFAERWARHWLDKARYADSDGYEKDNHRPDAWRYRDWVIHAIHTDLPFDEFTIQQLAGDMLLDRTPLAHLATAFHRQTLTNTEGGTDQEQWRVAAVMDRTETLGSVWLGLTVGCARCHNHKYDDFTQREYYQLFAYFNNGDETTTEMVTSPESQAKYERELAAHQDSVARQRKQVERIREHLLLTEEAQGLGEQNDETIEEFALTHEEYAQAKAELEELQAQAPKPPRMKVRVISEREEDRRTTHVLHRGEFKQPQESVAPGTPSTLPGWGADDASPKSRLEMARWLVSGENPLVPRVAVNHIWGHLFGQGIVRTVEDFGVRGERPTHPGLLDWLAGEYIRLGWSRKKLAKRIVMSATYRQQSRHRPELSDVDPTNRWLYRQNRFRVEAEAIRDLYLSAAGLLSSKIGGPSVFPPIPPGITDLNYNSAFQWKVSGGEDRFRRGMYTYFKRTAPHPNLTTFDCPDSNVTCLKRRRSNTPLAALVTLNNRVFHEASQALARRILTADLEGDGQRIERAFRLCVARPPEPSEQKTLHELLATSRDWYASHPEEARQLVGNYAVANVDSREAAAWIATVRIIMNMDEFITRE